MGLTRALIALGHEILISGPGSVPAEGAASVPLAADKGGDTTLAKRLPGQVYELAELAYSAPSFWRARKAAMRFHPDIIYERYNLHYLAGLWLKQQIGTPLILEVNAPLRQERAKHGGLSLPELARWSDQKIWRQADALLPVSQVLARHLIDDGVDPEKVHVIHNGIDLTEFADSDPDKIRMLHNLQDKIILGFTGFVRDWHGLDLILDYLAARRGRNMHLIVVGDGPHIPHLQARAKVENLQENVTFTGVVQRSEIPDHVASFDIALQPRVTDYASPLKLFEYMAMGKAIIAPAQANIMEVLQDGENAILFEPENKLALFSALDTLSSNATDRASLGMSARETLVSRDYTWEGNARRVEHIAEALLGGENVRRNTGFAD